MVLNKWTLTLVPLPIAFTTSWTCCLPHPENVISPVTSNSTNSSVQDKQCLPFKCVTCTVSDYLQLYTPSHSLCSASDTLSLQIPHTRPFTVSSCTFSDFSPYTWNDLALPLQKKCSLDSIKSNLKTFVFRNNKPVNMLLIRFAMKIWLLRLILF